MSTSRRKERVILMFKTKTLVQIPLLLNGKERLQLPLKNARTLALIEIILIGTELIMISLGEEFQINLQCQ
jgi:hypothetical protein